VGDQAQEARIVHPLPQDRQQERMIQSVERPSN